MQDMEKDFSPFEKGIGVQFKKKDYLRQAFVHRSYLNENPSFPLGHNERLEFLGDAVLELVVTEYLYAEYPDAPEGDMTNWRASLVNAKMLSRIASEIDMDRFLYLSKGESKDGESRARQYILANAIEALIGAIYLDRGYDIAKDFIARYVFPELPHILEKRLDVDPKSKLQECAQEKVRVTPSYQVLAETGPDHAKWFKVGVFFGKDMVATGEGDSKQEAQVNAATNALKERGWCDE